MKLPVIKFLAENQSLEALKEAEQHLMNAETLNIEVEGADEGEQLTHILGAIEVLENIQKDNVSLTLALRNFAQRVRKSID